jgi:hypothetical protein
MIAALWVPHDTGTDVHGQNQNLPRAAPRSTIRQIQRCRDLDIDTVAVVWLKGCGRRPHAPGRLCCGGLAGSMAMLGMPLLILNLGGEMVYILDQVDRTSPHCFHSAASF